MPKLPQIRRKKYLTLTVAVLALVLLSPYLYKVAQYLDSRLGIYIIKKTVETEHQKMGWQRQKNNLYQANNGDLGIKTREVIADTPYSTVDRYITYFGLYNEESKDNISLKSIIDTDSFQQLNKTFYRDKNHLYQHYDMSDGGMFYLLEIEDDIDKFSVLNECYAKDSHRIYHHRGSFDTSMFDYESFRTCADCCGYAKDKNGYYIFEHKIDIDNPSSGIDLEILEKLKAL